MGWQVISRDWRRPVTSALRSIWQAFRFTGDVFLKMDYERSRPPYKKSTINDEPASILLDRTRAHAIR